MVAQKSRKSPFNVFLFLLLKLLLFLVILSLGRFLFKIEASGFYYCLFTLSGLTLIWMCLYEFQFFARTTQAFLQFALDVAVETALIQFSGGLESPFILVLIFDLFLAAFVLSKPRVILLSAYIGLFYSLFTTLAYLGYLPDFFCVQQQVHGLGSSLFLLRGVHAGFHIFYDRILGFPIDCTPYFFKKWPSTR